ncbi:CIA30 family protein [Aliikangiella marina]|nr:CIA30 family protein [Aliikangiella marina]
MSSNLTSKNWLNHDAAEWWIVNDTVMGGRSASELLVSKQDAFMRFTGNLSLENNGGFASTRSHTPAGYFGDAEKVCIEVRGDGREYQFRLRSDRNFDGYAYVQSFQTQQNQWQSFSFQLANFVPQFRGRLIKGAPVLSADNIRQVGFLLGDKNPGRFQLDFRFIGAC